MRDFFVYAELLKACFHKAKCEQETDAEARNLNIKIGVVEIFAANLSRVETFAQMIKKNSAEIRIHLILTMRTQEIYLKAIFDGPEPY